MRLYLVLSAAILAGSLLLLVVLVSVVDLGLSRDGLVALFLGAFFTMGITLVLMGLVFRSNRSGRDRTVYDATAESLPPRDGMPPAA